MTHADTLKSSMPILYKIDAARRRVFTNVTGIITGMDIIGHFEVARREGFLPYSEFIDTSSIANPTLSVGEIGKAAMAVLKLRRHEKFGARAILVANDTIFGLTSIFTTLMSGYIPMEVFRDQTKAKAWLDDRHRADPNNQS
jgi:hypothetical protein